MRQELSEPRRQRLKRERRTWPMWLRSKHLIRWLIIFGPHVYRFWRFVYSLWIAKDG